MARLHEYQGKAILAGQRAAPVSAVSHSRKKQMKFARKRRACWR
jgi:hypothetical protein